MFQCKSPKSWGRTSPLWWPWLLNPFPFSKENKHIFVPSKHHWRRLGHPVSLGPLVPGWACLGLKPFSRRAEGWAWGQRGHIPVARWGTGWVWVLQGEPGVGGTHGTVIPPAGALRPHMGVLKPPGKSNNAQPVHFSLSQPRSSPITSLRVVISWLLWLVRVWPHPWVRWTSLPQRPGQGKGGRRNTAPTLIHT